MSIMVRADFTKEGKIIPLMINNSNENIRIDRILSIVNNTVGLLYECKSSRGKIFLLLQDSKWFLLPNDSAKKQFPLM